jgi:hypothetical protein
VFTVLAYLSEFVFVISGMDGSDRFSLKYEIEEDGEKESRIHRRRI